MASYSTNLLLALLAQGESGVLGFSHWGDAANSNFEFLEDTVTEKSDITVTSSDVTLSATENRSLYLNCSGTMTGNRSVIVAARKGFWFVYNNTSGAFTLTVKTSAGTGVVVPQGSVAAVYCDGTNVLPLSVAVTPAGAIALRGTGPEMTFLDTDTGADSSIGAGNSTGSLTLSADVNNEAANSAIFFTVDGTTIADFSGTAPYCNVYSASGGVLQLRSTNTAAGDDERIGEIRFWSDDNSNSQAGIRGRVRMEQANSAGTGGDMLFYTRQAGSAGSGGDQERFRIGGDGILVSVATYDNTSASAANMGVNASGLFFRSTSALKYKTDVQEMPQEMVDAFLSLRGVTYKSTAAMDDDSIRHVGMIADEAHAAGLSELVSYGANGEVEGFHYERGVAILLEVVKSMKTRLDAAGL